MAKRYRLQKNVLLFFFFLGCLLPIWAKGSQEADKQINGNFKFAFIILKEQQPVPITDPVITREIIKNKIVLYYKPISNSFIYIYAINPGKEFRQIKPASFSDFARYDYFYKPEYIFLSDTIPLQPDAACWEIHLLISTKRLPELEKLISLLTGIKPGAENALLELANKLNSEILNLKVKKILGYNPVNLPEPVNNPFRTNDDIKAWLDKNTVILNFTDIYECIYFYECKPEP